MAQAGNSKAGKQLRLNRARLPMLGAAAALMLGLPTAGLAVVGLGSDEGSLERAFDIFTPTSVDPELAARVEAKARERGIRFTPTAADAASRSDRTVTVAVRVDGEAAQAISVRGAAEGAPGLGTSVRGIQASRFNLGTARGYQSFARAQRPNQARRADAPVSGTVRLSEDTRLAGVRDLSVPDLAEFEPSRPSREDRPSRLQPRIALEDNTVPGRSPNTLDASEDSVDVGGAFRLSPNLDVTAGVRYSRERDRLDPLTNSVQDSQAVYVGTQLRF